MKLYVVKKHGDGKVFLNTSARTRHALATKIGGKKFNADGVTYYVQEVVAEKGVDNTGLGMLVGGVIGVFGGGAGVAAGGLIGGLIGKGQDKKEEAEVAEFNGSTV